MAQSLKEIKNRIRGIGNVNKVTRTMEMISVAKLVPARNQLAATRQYFSKIAALLTNISSANAPSAHPYIKKRPSPFKRALCLITSDTGLCAGYNNNVIRMAEAFINEYKGSDIMLIAVGKKGFNYFKRKGANILNAHIGLNGRYSDETANKILKNLTGIFSSGTADEVYICYTHFESASKYRPRIEKFLNIDSQESGRIEFILEPDIDAILEELLPAYIFNKLKMIILDAFASEHSSRVIAMGQASENAQELLQELILLRNKVRQASITKEIMEIISSVEVLS